MKALAFSLLSYLGVSLILVCASPAVGMAASPSAHIQTQIVVQTTPAPAHTSTTASTPQQNQADPSTVFASIRTWWNTTYEKIEQWRADEATHYKTVQAMYKKRLALNDGNIFSRDPETPNDTGVAKEYTNLGSYGGLVWSSAAASFFGNAFIFYGVLILLIFFIIRFFIGRAA